MRQWSPFIDYLTREVGVPFQLVMREDYQGLVDALVNGEIEFLEGGTVTHIMAMNTGLAMPVASEVRLGKGTYRSVFVVRANENAKTFADLKRKRIAFTDELSTSGYIVPRVMLARSGIANLDEFFLQVVLTGNHDRSIEALLEGAVDVIAVGDFFISYLPDTQRKRLKVIAVSDDIPAGPITVKKDFDKLLLSKVRDALLSYDSKMPDELRHIIEVEKFFAIEESAFDSVREYVREFQALPKLSYMTPAYQKIPTIFAKRIEREKKMVVIIMGAVFALLLIIVTIVAVIFHRNFSISAISAVTATAVIIAIIFAVIQLIALFSHIDSFAEVELGKIENTNLRVITAIESGSQNLLTRILENSVSSNAIKWAKIFRNGYVIASTNPSEIGTPIIDQIRAGTFASSERNTIHVLDPIIAASRKYATLEAGISFDSISQAAKKTVTTNIIVLLAILSLASGVLIVIEKKFIFPLGDIEKAINNIREGKQVNISSIGSGEIGKVAGSITRLGKDLIEKQQLLDLKTSEIEFSEQNFDPHVLQLLEERISSMEAGNENFRKLRMTEAIGRSPAWLRTIRDAAIRAKDTDPVVIYGQTGSGKTGIARVIHAISTRSEKPFGEFNCAEFASGDPLVVLGKLFGYGRDSGITGVDKMGQKGVLEEFDGGTLFLDEVSLLPTQAQQILLLPLEGRPFNPAAGKGPARIAKPRFIFASNEPLEELAHAGRMRKDLLRRILVRGIVKLPPLARRKEDIELLSAHFLAKRNAMSDVKLKFRRDTMDILVNRNFDKYNVSELKGVIDRAFDTASFEGSSEIRPEHMEGRRGADGQKNRLSTDAKFGADFDSEELTELTEIRMSGFNMTSAEKRLGYSAGSKTLTNRFRGIVYKALEKSGWDVSKTILILAGNVADSGMTVKIAQKIEDYISTAVKLINDSHTDNIFNNLPKKYHSSAKKFLEKIRKKEIQI